MEFPLPLRRRVYLYGRKVFSGSRSQLRKPQKIRNLVQKSLLLFEPLLRDMGETHLVEILQRLLVNRVFESDARARVEFPGVFSAFEGADAAQKESGITAAGSSADESNVDGSNVDQIPRGDDPVGQAQSTDEDVAGRDMACTPDASNVHRQPRMPHLSPPCFPYRAQHLLLATAQHILEECCFDFAIKWLPDVLEDSGWDCPAAVELTRWNRVIGKHRDKIPPDVLGLTQSCLEKAFNRTHQLRHTVVHRIPATARRIKNLLQSAVQLANALQDHRRASQLQILMFEVDSKIKSMEIQKRALQSHTSGKLETIRRQREELDMQEQQLVTNMVREDLNIKVGIGQLLEKRVEQHLGQMPDVVKATASRDSGQGDGDRKMAGAMGEV